MVARLLASATLLGALAAWPSAASAMSLKFSLKFSWAGFAACSPRSPAFALADVPNGTARLAFRMIDRQVPGYPHGGGTVAYAGGNAIAAGAFTFKGPCPPAGAHHVYQWTVRALDRAGNTLGSASAEATFPPE